jgi:DinB superfamily
MTTQYLERPTDSEYSEYAAGYVALVPENDVLKVLREQVEIVRELISSIPEEQELFRYAPGKWSIREMIGHLGDGERVFGFRAFTFSRGDTAALPGFDENEYVRQSNSEQTRLKDLLAEFIALRQSNIFMLEQLNQEAWARIGIANGNAVSVRAIVWIMAGHVRHHLNILTERYLQR